MCDARTTNPQLDASEVLQKILDRVNADPRRSVEVVHIYQCNRDGLLFKRKQLAPYIFNIVTQQHAVVDSNRLHEIIRESAESRPDCSHCSVLLSPNELQISRFHKIPKFITVFN